MMTSVESCRPRVCLAALCAVALCIGPPALGGDAMFDELALDVVLWRVAPQVVPFPTYHSADVLTQRVNNQRTGTVYVAGLDQHSFQFAFPFRPFRYLQSIEVDAPVLAQPLFVSSLNSPAGVVIVATANNTVYAFRANPPLFTPFWVQRHLGDPEFDPPDVRKHDGCYGLLANSQQNAGQQGKRQLGIEATPVVDLARRRIYVSYRLSKAKNSEGSTIRGEQRLAALDLDTGEVRNEIVVNPDRVWNQLHRNRASLLLDHGIVFVGFSARCEEGEKGDEFHQPFHGSIYAFDADSLEHVAHLAITEGDMDGGGIWQGSTGIAADGAGNLFVSTGNARNINEETIKNSSSSLSNSVLRIRVDKRAVAGTERQDHVTMSIADRFTPYRKRWLDSFDHDLSSGGVLLVPGSTRVLSVGKEGRMYVIDANALGGFDAFPRFDDTAVRSLRGECSDAPGARDDPARDHVFQKLRVGWNSYLGDKVPMSNSGCQNPNAEGWVYWPHVHGTPVFADFGPQRQFVFVWPEKDYLRAFRWRGDSLDTQSTCAVSLAEQADGLTTSDCAIVPAGVPTKALRGPPFVMGGANGMPGGMLAVVAHPARDGRGVIFASVKRCMWGGSDECGDQNYGSLHAIDPITMRELWNDREENCEAEKCYWFAKFVPPTIANGRVFLGTASNSVRVYGID